MGWAVVAGAGARAGALADLRWGLVLDSASTYEARVCGIRLPGPEARRAAHRSSAPRGQRGAPRAEPSATSHVASTSRSVRCGNVPAPARGQLLIEREEACIGAALERYRARFTRARDRVLERLPRFRGLRVRQQ